MSRVVYDSIRASNIPIDAEGVAGYVDGQWRWSYTDWQRFSTLIKVRIAVFADTNDGHVLDCEKGNATPSECPDWIRMRQAAGLLVPSIYCNRSTLPEVLTACLGLTYDLWIADWNGSPHIYPGSGATQYLADTMVRGYDLSYCEDWWPRDLTRLNPEPDGIAQLTTALAYVCDNIGNDLLSLQVEMRRVREQFIGPYQ